MYNFPYLKDKEFLKQFNKQKLKQQLIKINVLDNKDNFIQSISGRVTSGNINLDGSSAMRRTANISLIANEYENDFIDFNDLNNLLSINKKIEILIGFYNNTSLYSNFPVIWFPQGIFVISDPNLSYSEDGITINLTLHDKTAFLNGECGGTFPAAVIFHEKEEEDEYGNIIVSKPTIKQIIMQLLNHWGQQPLNKIRINGLEDKIKQVLKWNGDNPLYVYHPENINGYKASTYKSEIFLECVKNAYSNLNYKNLPDVNNLLKFLMMDKVSLEEIKNNQKVASNIENLISQLKTQSQFFNNEKINLKTVDSQLAQQYKSTAEEIAKILTELKNNLTTYYYTAWNNKYNTYIRGKQKYIKWLLPEYRTAEQINYVLKEINRLKTNIKTIKNIVGSQIVKTWKNNQKQKQSWSGIISPAYAMSMLLAQPKKTTTGIGELLTGLSVTIPNYTNETKLLYEVNNLYNKLKNTKTDITQIVKFINQFSTYGLKSNNYKPYIIRTDSDSQVYLEIYNANNKIYYRKKISGANTILLNVLFFDTLLQKDDIKNDKVKNQIDYNSFYYCIPKLFEISKLISFYPQIQKKLIERVVPALTEIFNASIITKDMVDNICNKLINICDYIELNIGTSKTYYDFVLQNWNEIKSLGINAETKYSFKENNVTTSQTFDLMINNKIENLRALAANLPIELNQHKMREPASEMIEDIIFLLNNIKPQLKDIQLNKIDITAILSQVNDIFISKTDTSIIYLLENKYLTYFKRADNQDSKENIIMYKKIEQTRKLISNALLTIEQQQKRYFEVLFNKIINNRIILKNQYKKIQNQEKKLETNNLQDMTKKINKMLISFQDIANKIINNIRQINLSNDLQNIIHNSYKEEMQRKIAAFKETMTKLPQQQLINSFYLSEANEAKINQLLIDYQNKKIKNEDTVDQLLNILNNLIDILKSEIQSYETLIEKTNQNAETALIYKLENLTEKDFFNAFISTFINKPKEYKSITTIQQAFPNLWNNFVTLYKQQQAQIDIYQNGQDIGYTLTDFYYPGTLIANAGQTIISVLDKIKNTLGNFEYFYDIDGNFVFQEIKNYLNTSYSSQILTNNASPNYNYDFTNGKFVYDFSDAEIVTSYTNSPKYQSIKNDFVIWGERKTAQNKKYPIRYHLSIDKKDWLKEVFYLDAPANIKYYNYSEDFPRQGNKDSIYYAKKENQFYEWKQEQNEYYLYKKVPNRLLSKKCKFYLSKQYFPTKLIEIQKEYYFYSQENDCLYKYNGENFYEVYSYRIKGCETLPTIEVANNYKLIVDKCYYIQNINKIVKWNGIRFLNTTFKPYFVTDYRTYLFLQGALNETMGQDTNYYYAELKNEWIKIYDILEGHFYTETIQKNAQINYFLDILNSNNLTQQYNITNIGRRTCTISNNAINCIFQPDVQDYFFIDKNPEINSQLSAQDKKYEKLKIEEEKQAFKNLFNKWKRNHLLNSTAALIELDHKDYINLVNGGTFRSAYEEIRTVLMQYLSLNEQVSLTTIPIYCLEPNSLVLINNKESGISGEYLIKTLSIPLDVSDTMSISASKAVSRI